MLRAVYGYGAMMSVNGVGAGAVRVSFGYMSTFEDAAAVVGFVREFFGAAEEQVRCACSPCLFVC